MPETKTKPKYKDEEWLYEKYVKKRKSEAKIAEMCNVSRSLIRTRLDNIGIYRPKSKYKDKEWLKEQYVKKENSASKIADKCRATESTILRWLKSKGIPRRDASHKVKKGGKEHPAWKGGEVTLVCEQCGQKYKAVSVRKNESRFCSKECHDKWQKKNVPKGEAHWLWKGGFDRNEWLRKKRKNDPKFKLNADMSRNICAALQGNKSGRHWEDLVPYTLEDLKEHLEEQFEEGMRWENHGVHGWHIDHIIPRNHFDYESPEDKEFQKCWALNNLQPLWAEDNRAKSDKMPYEYYLGNLEIKGTSDSMETLWN